MSGSKYPTSCKGHNGKNFDYQERWHGWRSPVGLSMGFAFFGLGLLFIGLAVAAVN